MRRTGFLCLLVLGIASQTYTATFVVPSEREMVRRATAIVIGSALQSRTQLTASQGIETVTSFSIEQTIKGFFPQTLIDIHEPGGAHGNHVTYIPGVPRLDPGERAIL